MIQKDSFPYTTLIHQFEAQKPYILRFPWISYCLGKGVKSASEESSVVRKLLIT